MRLRRRQAQGFKYSRWDGTQTGFDLDADALLEEMSDDLLYHGDLNAALRRMLQQGFRDRNDEELMDLFGSRRVLPHIGASFPLTQTAAALRYVGDGKAVGKVVLELD